MAVLRPVFASADQQSSEQSFDRLRARIEFALANTRESFPALADAEFTVWRRGLGDDRFFRAFPYPGGGLLLFNPRLESLAISESALMGAIAHACAHFAQYRETGFFGKIVIGFRYLFSDFFRRNFEKEADRRAIDHGFRNDLKNFRLWQKSVLSEEQWQAQMKIYLRPEEM